jgi:hypothetical protein
VFGASSDAQRIMVAPAAEKFVTLFREDASLSEVDRWLRDLNYKRLEGNADAEAKLNAVLGLLRSEFMPNGFSVDRVDSDGLWLKDRQGVTLSWMDMSDGYRAALALLGDILRHMMAAYGTDGLFVEEDGRLVVARSGVVLIDEIDAHLHPEWQREIGFWLTRHFPNVQFLVTSHSPLICQAASARGLFHLPEPGSGGIPFRLNDETYTKVIASRPDTILLSPAFGLENSRSPRAVAWGQQYSRLRAKQRAVPLSEVEQLQMDELQPYINAMDEES